MAKRKKNKLLPINQAEAYCGRVHAEWQIRHKIRLAFLAGYRACQRDDRRKWDDMQRACDEMEREVQRGE